MSGSIHASAIVVRETGVLLRGPAGSGKSFLSLAIMAHVRRIGEFAALIADDRVRLSVVSGRLIGECISGFAGLVERRGVGIIRVTYERRAVLRLVVDLVPRDVPVARMPSEQERSASILGVVLPRLELDLALGGDEAVLATIDGLDRLEKGDWRKNADEMTYFA